MKQDWELIKRVSRVNTLEVRFYRIDVTILNFRTAIKMHWNATSVGTGTTCAMLLRSIYHVELS